LVAPRRVESDVFFVIGTMPRDEKEREHFARARAREAKHVAVVEAEITQARAHAAAPEVAAAAQSPAAGGGAASAMNEVVPGVFLGGIDCISRAQVLADAGVTFLLSCCLEAPDIVTVRGASLH
jgi:hypothetical protein